MDKEELQISINTINGTIKYLTKLLQEANDLLKVLGEPPEICEVRHD